MFCEMALARAAAGIGYLYEAEKSASFAQFSPNYQFPPFMCDRK